MFAKVFETLRSHNNNAPPAMRRRHPRRHSDQCATIINGRLFPVENWSFGGLAISGDERVFSPEETCDITLKFKLRDGIIDITHKARVVRRSAHKIAFEFLPLTKAIRRDFQLVVDDFVVRRFADSQMV